MIYISGIGDGITDDTNAVQSAIDLAASQGGGEVLASPNSVYRCSLAPVVKEGVHLNLQGSTILQVLSATSGVDGHGMRLKSRSSVGRGKIITLSSNASNVDLNASIHSAVSIGPGYGTGGTVAQPSEHERVNNWRLYDLELSTDKNISVGGNTYGGVSLQICGGVHSGVIERVVIPDSSVQAGGIHLDWGFLGPLIRDVDSPSLMQQNKTAYFNNTVRTTHPHNIIIRDNRIGKLTKPQVSDRGGHGIRLSSVYGIKVYDNVIDNASYIGIFHHGGDYGFEFSDILPRHMAIKGTEIKGNIIKQAGLYGLLIDGYADNVYRAVQNGYDKIIAPIMPTNLKVSNNLVNGQTGSVSTIGMRYQYINGGRFEDNVFINCGSYISAGSNVSNNYLYRNMGGSEAVSLI